MSDSIGEGDIVLCFRPFLRAHEPKPIVGKYYRVLAVVSATCIITRRPVTGIMVLPTDMAIKRSWNPDHFRKDGGDPDAWAKTMRDYAPRELAPWIKPVLEPVFHGADNGR